MQIITRMRKCCNVFRIEVVMRLTDDYDIKNESRTNLPIVYMALGGMMFFVMIISMVLLSNTKKTNRNNYNTNTYAISQDEVAKEDDLHLGESNLKSDDLDFWDMYKTDEKTKSDSVSVNTGDKADLYAKRAEELSKEEDPSEGGTKTEITFPDGTKQWVPINNSVSKNSFDSTSLVYQDPIMRYYIDGEKSSAMGVTVSEKDGDVDFEKLKNAGVDYVMIQLLTRGYESGIISFDEKYYSNIQKAQEAGLDVGVIVSSQAKTKEEAEEEAQSMIDALIDFQISYPVAFELQTVNYDTSRTAKLTKIEMTAVAVAFCNKIRLAGFHPIIRANKYWLIRKVDLTLLSNYDIWLDSPDTELPDYPYEFSMWQYSKTGKINGIEEDARLNICFIDYKKK